MVGRLIYFKSASRKVVYSDMKTGDYKFTQRGLQRRIKMIVREEYDSSDEMVEEVSQYIINCFDNTGLVETYNELGWRKWKQMIIEYIREIEREEQYMWN